MSYTLGELATLTATRVVGDPACVIAGVGTLSGARAGQITFLANPRYRKFLHETRASAVIVGEAEAGTEGVNLLVGRNPHLVYAKVAALFAPAAKVAPGIHASAVVDASAQLAADVCIGANAVIGAGVVLGRGVVVGPGCVVDHDAQIGEETRLVANVTVYHGCLIGRRCLIHANSVIGSDGFGFANDGGNWIKVPQLGRVRIGDEVEIGACTTVDRGAIEDTIIEDGVKLDNQIQVAHNVRIGTQTAIAGCVGIAGSTTIGKRCAIGGGVGIVGHLEIADGVTVTATSFVSQSIKEPGVYSSGVPLEATDHWHKNFARFKQLDEMARRLKSLEKELQELKTKGVNP